MNTITMKTTRKPEGKTMLDRHVARLNAEKSREQRRDARARIAAIEAAKRRHPSWGG